MDVWVFHKLTELVAVVTGLCTCRAVVYVHQSHKTGFPFLNFLIVSLYDVYFFSNYSYSFFCGFLKLVKDEQIVFPFYFCFVYRKICRIFNTITEYISTEISVSRWKRSRNCPSLYDSSPRFFCYKYDVTWLLASIFLQRVLDKNLMEWSQSSVTYTWNNYEIGKIENCCDMWSVVIAKPFHALFFIYDQL